MLCVAINNKDSLNNVAKWKTEIRQVCPDTPIILIGTKSDMMNVVANSITANDLQRKSDSEGLQGFCLTSSKAWQDHNVNKAF